MGFASLTCRTYIPDRIVLANRCDSRPSLMFGLRHLLGLEKIGESVAQGRLHRPGRVSKLALRLLVGKRARSQRDPNPLGGAGWRAPGYVIGDKLEHGRSGFRHRAGNRYLQASLADGRADETQNVLERHAFPAKKIALTRLAALHRQNE